MVIGGTLQISKLREINEEMKITLSIWQTQKLSSSFYKKNNKSYCSNKNLNQVFNNSSK